MYSIWQLPTGNRQLPIGGSIVFPKLFTATFRCCFTLAAATSLSSCCMQNSPHAWVLTSSRSISRGPTSMATPNVIVCWPQFAKSWQRNGTLFHPLPAMWVNKLNKRKSTFGSGVSTLQAHRTYL